MLKVLWIAILLPAISAFSQGVPPVESTSENLLGGAAAPKKPTIEELMKTGVFTNDTGMIMVKLSGFWASKYEITQEVYTQVVGSNPSKYRGDLNPVDSVSWSDAIAFCEQLTAAEKKAKMLPEGQRYTLPTQQQWEGMAAGASLAESVTSDKAPRTGPAAVGSKNPTAAGLHDVRGNVWEFCLDHDNQPYRVLRGAAWNVSYEPSLRLEFRWYANGPDDRQDYYGFRCVLVPEK